MSCFNGIAAAAALLAAFPSFANEVCTLGSARAWSQMAPVGAMVTGRSAGRARMADIRAECQYRLFWDGAEVDFDAGDFILGGVNWFNTITADFSREDGIADIALIEDRLQIARIGEDGTPGPLVDQPLAETAFKDVVAPDGTNLVYQQHYFIAQLPPGDYVSVLTSTYAGELNFTATVYLHVR